MVQSEPGYTLNAVANSNVAFDETRQKMKDGKVAVEQERLDYCILLEKNTDSGFGIECKACRVDTMDDLSDHYGLHIEFELARLSAK